MARDRRIGSNNDDAVVLAGGGGGLSPRLDHADDLYFRRRANLVECESSGGVTSDHEQFGTMTL